MKQVLKEFEISWFMLENLIINNYFIKIEFIKKKVYILCHYHFFAQFLISFFCLDFINRISLFSFCDISTVFNTKYKGWKA